MKVWITPDILQLRNQIGNAAMPDGPGNYFRSMVVKEELPGILSNLFVMPLRIVPMHAVP